MENENNHKQNQRALYADQVESNMAASFTFETLACAFLYTAAR